ncbi:MAG: twin transmembrane helix small protein [Alphaproteobacteria bacterium]|nr:twin transmembrane helix small protein [Alphaproteobacteria bacterium]
MNLLNSFILMAMLATAIVLGLGVAGMMRRRHSPERSNLLMRLRIVFQAVAVVLLALTIWGQF